MRLLSPQEFPFVGPHDLQVSPYQDPSQTINLYYEPAYTGAGAQSVPALVSTPGVSGSIVSLTAGKCRALASPVFTASNALFAVGGNHIYKVTGLTVGGGSLLDFGAMAGDDGLSVNNKCYFAGAPTAPAFAVGNPYSQQVYSIDVAGNTNTSRISGYALEYLDGFFITLTSGASLVGTNPNQINCSAFNDPTSWPALQFVLKEGSSDRLMNLAVVNNLLWIIGQSNIEIWYNAGLPNFPFARVNGGTLNVGCICSQSVVKINNGVMWLGSSNVGRGIVYMSRGSFIPQRVSTSAVEQYIQNATPPGTTQLAIGGASGGPAVYAFTYMEYGHEFYELVIPGSLAMVYDITMNTWHARSQGGTNQNNVGASDLPFAAISIQGNPTAGVQPWAGTIVGDRTSNNLFLYGRQFTSMNGTAIFRMRTAPHISESLRWIKYPFVEVDADVGTATLNLFYSNNGGKTYANLNRPDSAKTGSTDQGSNTAGGTYPRFRWNQCGRSRRRSYGVWCLDGSNPIVITRAVAAVVADDESRAAA